MNNNKDFGYKDKNTDILVLSTASHTAINRSVYRLLNKNFKVVLVCPKTSYLNGRFIKSDLRKENDPFIIFDDIDTRNPRINNFKHLTRIFKVLKPKRVIVDNDPASLMAVKSGILAKFFGSEFFCLTCENLSLNFLDNLKRKGSKYFFSISLKYFLLIISKLLIDTVFTINESGKKHFLKKGFKRVIKVPLGYDPDFFSHDTETRSRYRKKLKINCLAIGFLGRLVYEKGPHILIEALSNLRNYDWILVMDEFKDYESDYSLKVGELINSLDLRDRIIMINPSHEEMGNFINALDIVVLPSISTSNWMEQYGRIAAESLACGRQVIYSKSGHLPDLIGSFGSSFEEANVVELSQLIEKVLNSSKNIYSHSDLEKYAYSELSIYKQAEMMESAFNN